MMYNQFFNYSTNVPLFGTSLASTGIAILVLWEAVWKALALWKAARNGATWWFIAILIFNTIGILPILYLYVFSKGSKPEKKSE